MNLGQYNPEGCGESGRRSERSEDLRSLVDVIRILERCKKLIDVIRALEGCKKLAPFQVRRLFPHCPVVCGPPATIFHAVGVDARPHGWATAPSAYERPPLRFHPAGLLGREPRGWATAPATR
jgi:hypothetical protein